MTEAEALRCLNIFRFVPMEALEAFCRFAPAIRLPPGMEIIRQGAMADMALLLVSGKLVAKVRAEGGKVLELGRIWPGEIVGERALFCLGGLRSASVFAETESVCHMLTWSTLDSEIVNPAVVALEDHLLTTLAGRLRRTNEVVHDIWRASELRGPDQTDTERLRTLLEENG